MMSNEWVNSLSCLCIHSLVLYVSIEQPHSVSDQIQSSVKSILSLLHRIHSLYLILLIVSQSLILCCHLALDLDKFLPSKRYIS